MRIVGPVPGFAEPGLQLQNTDAKAGQNPAKSQQWQGFQAKGGSWHDLVLQRPQVTVMSQ